MATKRLIILLLSLVLVLTDQLLKAWALANLRTTTDSGMFALTLHKNIGLAFDIPFKMPVIITISLIIGAILLNVARKNWNTHPGVATATLVILFGASGNLYDRVIHGFTVDYLLIMGRLAINMCDVLIVGGVIYLLFQGVTPWKHAPLDREAGK